MYHNNPLSLLFSPGSSRNAYPLQEEEQQPKIIQELTLVHQAWGTLNQFIRNKSCTHTIEGLPAQQTIQATIEDANKRIEKISEKEGFTLLLLNDRRTLEMIEFGQNQVALIKTFYTLEAQFDDLLNTPYFPAYYTLEQYYQDATNLIDTKLIFLQTHIARFSEKKFLILKITKILQDFCAVSKKAAHAFDSEDYWISLPLQMLYTKNQTETPKLVQSLEALEESLKALEKSFEFSFFKLYVANCQFNRSKTDENSSQIKAHCNTLQNKINQQQLWYSIMIAKANGCIESIQLPDLVRLQAPPKDQAEQAALHQAIMKVYYWHQSAYSPIFTQCSFQPDITKSQSDLLCSQLTLVHLLFAKILRFETAYSKKRYTVAMYYGDTLEVLDAYSNFLTQYKTHMSKFSFLPPQETQDATIALIQKIDIIIKKFNEACQKMQTWQQNLPGVDFINLPLLMSLQALDIPSCSFHANPLRMTRKTTEKTPTPFDKITAASEKLKQSFEIDCARLYHALSISPLAHNLDQHKAFLEQCRHTINEHINAHKVPFDHPALKAVQRYIQRIDKQWLTPASKDLKRDLSAYIQH